MNNKLNEYKYSGTFANRKYEELSHNKNPKMNNPILVTLLKMSIQSWKCDPIQSHIPISLLYGSLPLGE